MFWKLLKMKKEFSALEHSSLFWKLRVIKKGFVQTLFCRICILL